MPPETKVFAQPVLRGQRFADHSLPLEAAEGLMAYRELVRNLAKHLFNTRNGRSRAPRGFDKTFDLKLKGVHGDCAVPVLARPEIPDVPPGANPEDFDYAEFDHARDLIARTVQALALGQELPGEFPEEMLADLEAFGDTFEADESIELRGVQETPGPVLDYKVRRRITQERSRGSYTETTTIEGRIIGFDLDKSQFKVRTLNRRTVEGTFEPRHEDRVLKALAGKKWCRVRITGTVRFSAGQVPVRFEEIGSMVVWTRTSEEAVKQVEDRLHELASLPPGWLEGEGKAVPAGELEWFRTRMFALMVDHGLPRPKLYATEDGNLQAVWRPLPWRIEAEFDLSEKSCSLLAMNVESDEDQDKELEFDLTTEQGEKELAEFLKRFLSAADEVTVE